jgi:N-acetylgalactosamine kinase
VLGPDQVERHSPTVNESIYIGNIDVLEDALHRIGRANAQDEYYLTDVIDLIGGTTGATPVPKGTMAARVIEYRCRRGDEVLAFNTRDELQRIEEQVRKQERHDSRQIVDRQLAGYLRTPEAWLELLGGSGSRGRRLVERTYGLSGASRRHAGKERPTAAGALVVERLGALRKVVRLFARTFGSSRRMVLVRAPGRVNLMGRHIDHQGGFVHAMALDREVLMAVSPRDDDVIRVVNADPVAFGARELVIGDWRGPLSQGDWTGFVDGPAVRTHLLSTAGDWSNYVLAAALFQQHRHPDQRIRGMDAAVYGNVPMAAGLSSSSSMVVASMEAIVAVNAIHGSGPDIVSWCGQAEWFVGSRGGSSDHAAIRLGRAGHAARMGFFPFRLSRYVPIPPEAAVLVAYSGQHAVKSAGARDRFNERVACYHIGIMLLQRRHARLASRIERVRDLSPSRLGVEPDQVRDMVNDLPEHVTRAQIRRELGPKFSDRLERVFSSHRDPGAYTLRDVVAYGVGECERSRLAANYLERGDLAGFGELMLLSHDGDRLDGTPASTGGSAGGQDGSNESPLSRLVGAYACSTSQIDRLVDIARSVPGVYGAQLAGAGLGGCVMILAKTAAVPSVKATLAREYYRPLGMAPAVWQVRSVSGGGLIRP